MKKTYIIDGNSLLFRSFYAFFRPGVPVMTSSKGIPTNAVFAFRNMMKKIRSDLSEGDRMIVCFDTGKKTFRSEKLDSYKMNRKPCEPELKAQMPLARELLDGMGIFHCEKEGFEGDDLAGSLTDMAAKKGDEVFLFTSDKDFLQLLQPHVQINFLRKGLSDIQHFDESNIKAQMGYEANQVIDYKGLVGDPSDNIPGIKGVGEKTALKLLDQYPHLEDIFLGIKDEKSKTMLNIINNKDMAFFCREIATIKRDVDVAEFYASGEVKDYNYDKLLAFYKTLDLNKFASELIEEENNKNSLFASEEAEQKAVDEYPSFEKRHSIKEMGIAPKSAVFSSTASNPHQGELEGLFFSDGSKVFFISTEDLKADEGFKSFLVNSHFDTYDLKGLLICLNRCGLCDDVDLVKCGFDLQLATYLLNADVGMDQADCLSFFSRDVTSLDRMNQLGYLAYFIASNKDEVILKLQKDEELDLLNDVEMPLCYVLTKMEIEGFPINEDVLGQIGNDFNLKLTSIKNQILAMVGHDINLNSPMQMSALIYDELKLKKKGKTNSTGIEVLQSLEDEHPVIPLIIQYRKYQKLVSSYTDSLGKFIYPDKKIHALFNQAIASTGRLSMSEPNLQNISIRDEEAKEIRKAFFYPNKEYQFLSLDYSQIELRVLASIADLKELIEVFDSGIDIHTATASKVFNVPVDQVTPIMRRHAKAVNFGIVYGISSWGLADRIKVSPSEASQIIASFYASYPGLREYEKKTIDFAHQYGYVKTVLNRRRYLPGIESPNRNIVSFSERAAVNMTIQGSAADLIKVAMIKINDLLKDYKTKMILQIHDELIFKVPKEEVGIIDKKIHDAMVSALPLKCKLEAEGSYGDTWYDCK